MKYTAEYWNDVDRVIDSIPNLSKLYGKRIFITGATGMVCSVVVEILEYLNKKNEAGIKLLLAGRNKKRILHRFAGVLGSDEFEFVKYDATKNKDIDAKIDYIIHGASNANPAIYAREPVETLLGNIIGISSMLQLARKNMGSRLLYVSSSEVYGKKSSKDNKPYKEDDYGFVDILNPRSCYPNGKRTAETLCASYNQEYGTDYVVVRLGHIYGPSITLEDSRASASFTRDVVSGNNIVMKSAGNQIRSYCYTLDCASAILSVLINGETCNAYNISNRNSIVSIRELADEFAKAGGVQVVFEEPSDIEKKSYNMMSNSSLDSHKLEALGWRGLFDLSEGVKRTLQYYK